MEITRYAYGLLVMRMYGLHRSIYANVFNSFYGFHLHSNLTYENLLRNHGDIMYIVRCSYFNICEVLWIYYSYKHKIKFFTIEFSKRFEMCRSLFLFFVKCIKKLILDAFHSFSI